jgi:hypothetical protein
MNEGEASLSRAGHLVAAALIVLHILVMFSGFTILADVFQFPDILRAPADERFVLFRENQHIIQPTYWALTMTGFTQILISVLLFHAAGEKRSALLTMALVFGALTGIAQAMGFGRWVILIPYLIEQAEAAGGAAGTSALIEGAFNHYAGMLVGEHLANICWLFWLVCLNLALLRLTNLDRVLCWFGLALSPLLAILAGEQIGLSGPILEPITDIGFPLFAVWHFGLAWSLILRRPDGVYRPLGWLFWLFAILAAGAMIAPMFF